MATYEFSSSTDALVFFYNKFARYDYDEYYDRDDLCECSYDWCEQDH